MRILKKILIAVALTVVLCFAGLNIYARDYYHADDSAVAVMAGTEFTDVYTIDDMLVFQPHNPVAGFIFYPGGKMDYTAYALLMEQLAEKGVLCIVPHMPYNLAVMDVNAANDIIQQYTQVSEWYIGGHSLGGAMAATYVAENADDFFGLVLLASYSTSDLTDTNIKVLSVYGNRDNVLNMEKYNKYHSNLPQDAVEIVIDGGNHAQFGNYGRQSNDGIATISAAQQQTQTVAAIMEMIEK